MNAEKTRVSGVQLVQASSFERFTQIKKERLGTGGLGGLTADC